MEKIRIVYNGQIHEPTQFPLRIGRSAENDIVICAPGVSKAHALIENTPEGLILHSVAESHLNGNKIHAETLLKRNGMLTLGTATLGVQIDPQQKTAPLKRTRAWKLIAHPVAACIWFVLALFMPLWINYLNTENYYIFNWHLFFTVSLILFALVWLLHSIVLPIAGRNLVFPLLGMVALLFLFNQLFDQALYWYAFQFGNHGLDGVKFFASAGVCIWLLRAFLRNSVPLYGSMLNRYTLLLALPLFFLLFYDFMKNKDFFSHRAGSYPRYHHGLLRDMAPWQKAISLEQFFN